MKRWILPIFCALTGHALLFTCDPGWQRPALRLPASRSVSISLVTPPPPANRPSVAPLADNPPAAVAPLPTVAPPRPPAPVPAAEPPPAVAPTPDPPSPPEPPLQTPAAAEAVGPETPVDPAPQTNTAPPPAPSETEPAAVQASVPLYHLNPAPEYPALARRRAYQGTVLLDVRVDRQGGAAEVRVAQSSGHVVLDRSAVAGVRRWRFEPARRLGQPVEMWVQVPVRFALE